MLDSRIPTRVSHRIQISDSGCWEWTGPLDIAGYGSISYKSRNWRLHRFTWTMLVGEIKPGLHIHHKCENKRCCNPAHLEALTPSQHAMVSPSRLIFLSRTHCPKGHRYDDGNTYRNNSAKGDTRRCRACTKAANQDRYKRSREVLVGVPCGAGCGDAVLDVARELDPVFTVNEVLSKLDGRYTKLQITRSFQKHKEAGRFLTVCPKYSQTPATFTLA